MRWLARHASPPTTAIEAIDRIDLATLEVVEITVDGRLRGPETPRDARGIPEVEYAPLERDSTSLAGVWEALAAY
jgi:hypothetical protein